MPAAKPGAEIVHTADESVHFAMRAVVAQNSELQ
jgi:hypothetical protein